MVDRLGFRNFLESPRRFLVLSTRIFLAPARRLLVADRLGFRRGEFGLWQDRE